ncbi:MAG: TonB-dependent receptor [Muribaculaceae bacterium]|nr:TonB-dependent receptor [Muribaculaceae bacterium]
MAIVGLIMALMAGSGISDSASDLVVSSPDTLETVVVTATRTPKLLKDIPVVTRVITSVDIERSGRPDIGALLEQQMPGVEFSLGMAQNPQINISGFGGGGILFLLDGERMAGETLDNPDYSRLNLQNVERVEIVKGAASSLYGSNATGGVVNIISGRPKEGSHLKLNARYGSHSLQSYGALATYRKCRMANTLDARFDSQGEIRFPNRGDFSKAYATHSWNVRDRITLTFDDDASLTARAGYYWRQRNSTNATHDRYSDISAGLSVRWKDFIAKYSFDSYDKYDYEIATKEQIRDYRNRQNTLHAQYSHEFSDKGTLTVGGDWLHDYLMSYEFDSDSYSQTNLDAYMQWDWQPAKNVWLVPGLRYDWFSASRANRVSPKLSMLWRPGKGHCALRLNYAAGFRAPTLKELYMDFDMAGIFHVFGNPDLKSETSHNMSVSAEYLKGNRSLTIMAFHNIVDNRISYLWNESLAGQQYINLRRLLVAGLDVSAMKSFSFGLTLNGEYVYTYERYGKGDIKANPTRPHALTLRADYSREWKAEWKFSATANFKWLSAVTGDVMSFFSQESVRTQRYPAYSMLGLALGQTFPKGITLGINIDNLLNYIPDYYFYNSPLTTGIGGSVSLTWQM